MKNKKYILNYDKLFIGRFDEEWIIFTLENYKPYILNKIASLILDQTEKGKTLDEIASYISDRYCDPHLKIKKEIKSIYDYCIKKTILINKRIK